jgi:hypothetical protein
MPSASGSERLTRFEGLTCHPPLPFIRPPSADRIKVPQNERTVRRHLDLHVPRIRSENHLRHMPLHDPMFPHRHLDLRNHRRIHPRIQTRIASSMPRFDKRLQVEGDRRRRRSNAILQCTTALARKKQVLGILHGRRREVVRPPLLSSNPPEGR